MQVQMQIKTVYGNVTYYPVNEAAGKRFAAIAGTEDTQRRHDQETSRHLALRSEYVDALRLSAFQVTGNIAMLKIVYNKLLGGWFVVRGPHQTPLSGRFDSRAAALASLASKS